MRKPAPMNPEPLPLATVLTRARRALALNFPGPLWVRAEVTQLTERRGNRYLTLSQKDDGGERARIGGQLWSRDYARVLRTRGKPAAEVLEAGREVSLHGELELHEVYGLKLRILDWDPAFTLGQIELERRAVLERLRTEGLLGLNEEAASGPVYQRLAVLTSAAAAGLADFRQQLAENGYNYAFDVTLFDVAVQGERTVESVTAALAAVAARADEFDAVCLLRGGGGRLDLASFDRYEIGSAIAMCPLPVLVGIGHEIDETVPDFVAHTSLKTPTALAEYVIQRAARYEAAQLRLARQIGRLAEARRRREAVALERQASGLRQDVLRGLSSRRAALDVHGARLLSAVSRGIGQAGLQLEAREAELRALDPARVLARGFSITYAADGRAVKAAANVAPGDALTTVFADGRAVTSIAQ